MAQEQARSQSVEIFGGELFGDKLTDTPVSGRNPRLNVKYYVSSNLYVDALARYRYLDRLVSDSNQHMTQPRQLWASVGGFKR
jgi:hypothetical protein